MNSRMTSAVPKLLQLFLVLCLALALFVPASSGAGEPSPAEVRAIAKEAYVYGYPLVDNYRILYFFTLDRSSPAFKAPVNELDNETRLYSPEDRVILCPNSDTLYSGASFDLRTEPYVITLPKIEKNRYYSVQLIDLYTFNFDYLGQPHDRQRWRTVSHCRPRLERQQAQGHNKSRPFRNGNSHCDHQDPALRPG